MTMVSTAIYDAWKITPPCEREENKWTCTKDCPYYHSDCWGDDEEEESI